MTTKRTPEFLTTFLCSSCLSFCIDTTTLLAWNYPYLSSLNGVLPSIIAGNSVILKHSSQTPLCGERFGQAWTEAGLPDGVFQVSAFVVGFVPLSSSPFYCCSFRQED